jgi:hypothetical protein
MHNPQPAHTANPTNELTLPTTHPIDDPPGKTHMDELAYSLNGENAHYGTPVNVAAPGRIPGGSSSGSAVSHLQSLGLKFTV